MCDFFVRFQIEPEVESMLPFLHYNMLFCKATLTEKRHIYADFLCQSSVDCAVNLKYLMFVRDATMFFNYLRCLTFCS